MVLSWLVSERQYGESGSAATMGWPCSTYGMNKEGRQSLEHEKRAKQFVNYVLWKDTVGM
jgi:hypothetical protein